MINFLKTPDEQLLDKNFRKQLIECVDLECNDFKSAVLFFFMLKKSSFFTKEEVNNFFKSSILIIDDSNLLLKILKHNNVGFEKKRDISEKLINHKIASFNFEAAKFYESKKFYEQLGDIEHKSKMAIIKQQVFLHCEVVANCEDAILNQKCLNELSFSNKKLHKQVLGFEPEK